MTTHISQPSKQHRRKTRYPVMVTSHDPHASSSSSYRGPDFYTPTRDSPSYISRILHSPIDYIRNIWRSHSRTALYDPLTAPPRDTTKQGWAQVGVSVISAPRFRRYLFLYITLVLLGWAAWVLLLAPRLQERANLLHSLNPGSERAAGGWFGKNSMPMFDDLTNIATLDPSLLPVATVKGQKEQSRRRLVFVGDVHGCKDELLKLLDKVHFSREKGDHLILTGDIINKGPDSGGVVDLARKLEASCVRGNHEDRILLHRKTIQQQETAAVEDQAGTEQSDDDFLSAKQLKERDLARSLTDEQVQWLNACPVILDVGQVPGIGQVVVVHGGLVPGVELEQQDPSTVMTMRTIDMDTHVPSSSNTGVKWSKMFDEYQSNLYSTLKKTSPDPRSQTMTVIYGHDAKSGLAIRDYTKGLDSGCIKGEKLTALVIEDGGKQTLYQVKCRNYEKED